jgi:hypothetical protein
VYQLERKKGFQTSAPSLIFEEKAGYELTLKLALNGPITLKNGTEDSKTQTLKLRGAAALSITTISIIRLFAPLSITILSTQRSYWHLR